MAKSASKAKRKLACKMSAAKGQGGATVNAVGDHRPIADLRRRIQPFTGHDQPTGQLPVLYAVFRLLRTTASLARLIALRTSDVTRCSLETATGHWLVPFAINPTAAWKTIREPSSERGAEPGP